MQKKIFYPKRIPLFKLIDKIKLWPSRTGVLHGIKSFEVRGDSYALITTHCNKQMIVRNSKNSHAARWLRNKWYAKTCDKCRVPQWKIEKYSVTVFKGGRFSSYLYQQSVGSNESAG
ncbi:MAG: pyrrolysine--tRNA(Pyl) ligase small subunit [Dehalococcoidales bacterium]